MRTALVLLVTVAGWMLAGTLHAVAGTDYRGVTVKERGSLQTDIVVAPDLVFDTVTTSGGPALRSRIPGARVRQTSDGSIIQLVVSVDVPVTNRHSYVMDDATQTTTTSKLKLLLDRAPDGSPLPTSGILDEPVSVRYGGIGRGQAFATVDVVVAEHRNGTTVLHPVSGIRIQHRERRTINEVFSGKVAPSVQGIEALSPAALATITQEGVYRITAQQLRDGGLPTDAEAARRIKVLGWGGRELSEQIEPALNDEPNEQAITVHTNSDGSIADIVFYACGPTGWQYGSKGISHYIHHYDRDAHYVITTAGGDGLRSVPRTSESGPAVNTPLQVDGFAFNEDEMVNPYNSGSGRKWLGRTVENGGSLVVSLPLPGLLRNNDTVQYRSVVAHRSTTVNGTFTVYENTIPVMQRSVPPVPEYMDTYSVEASGKLVASKLGSDGRSALRFEYACSNKLSTGLLDWVEVIYPRGLIADDRSFSFFTKPNLVGVTEYSVNGFESNDIYIYDVSAPQSPQRIENAAPAGGLAVIRERLDSGTVRRYYISSNIRSTTIRALPAMSLRQRIATGELGSMILVTHPDLLASAERYAQYRTSQGEVQVNVVLTTEIVNEFGYGTQDPTALRDFLGYAYKHAPAKPLYVLLWGDGHFDYKGLSTSQANFIPPYESLDPDDAAYGLSTYTTDDYFVRVDGNDARVDIAIGRLPVVSNDVGDMLREKIDHYEHGSAGDDWRTRITLMADDGPTSDNKTDGSLHLDQSEDLASNRVPADYQDKKIYLVEYPTDNIARGRRKPGANNDLVSTVNTTGGILLNWIGHGNPRVWAHEFAFERETTPQRMTNWDKLFFLTAATCDFARFDLTDVQSGAEELVLLSDGGAIGTFSSARVVFSYANAELNKAFYAALFTPDAAGRTRPLGDVLFSVKQQFTSDNDEKYFLMADPSMRLLIPDCRVVFDTVNGQPLTDTTNIQLQALQTVTVTGYVAQPLATIPDQGFTGVATISLLDGEKKMVVTDDDVNHTVNKFTLPGALLCKGAYPIANGRFSATFVVPKDIAFSSGTARLYGYAISNDQRSARGVNANVVVSGISSEQHDDEDGPGIAIYMDSRYFLSGQIVRQHPILLVDLEDATGINATGVGVGHDIEADFDNGSLIEVLTESFSTSLENPKAGTASKQIFGLSAGEHTVKVRAWDVLNNTSEASTLFRIASSNDGVVGSWLMNYPNPFSTSTTIRFQHNANQPFTAIVRIYDMQGRLVHEQDMEIRDMQTAEVMWNGRDGIGNIAGTGVYVCNVQVTEANGNVGNIYGKLALIR